MSKPKGFFTYFHHGEMLSALSDVQAGRLYKALANYGNTGELPDFSDDRVVQVAFILFKVEIDYNFERYQEACEKYSEAGKKGGRPKKSQDADGE